MTDAIGEADANLDPLDAARVDALAACLRSIGAVAVAVSGGVDSMTLASFARRVVGDVEVMHATSPAVPPEATRRVRDRAAIDGWRLTVFDAGEFADAAYRANPVDRCFHCKTHLYDAIAVETGRPVLSGANTDDLGEYRPGLVAAARHGVRHPFVEAGIDKSTVRRLARSLGLDDIADLPAAPCLSSRVETGIAIEPAMLSMIHAVESDVRSLLADANPATVRCRVRASGIVVELDEPTLSRLPDAHRVAIDRAVRRHAAAGDATVRIEPYRTGSAFIRIRG